MTKPMEALERSLTSRPLAIAGILAVVMSLAACWQGTVSEDALPFGDGEHYVLRCMTLYGFLHSGQWSRFWELFTLPKQSLAPLQYWLFFLVPQKWASLMVYAVIQLATTYGLLAFGVWSLCRALDRVPWTPALFVFCAVQNISMDASYFYFADFSFFAMGTLALAWQVEAWKELNWRNSVFSGAGAGVLFWLKAPNAVIFLGTYLIAESAWAILTWREIREKAREAVGDSSGDCVGQNGLGRHAAAVAAGFIPLAFLALVVCGGFQSIARLIDLNEVSGVFTTTLECTGLTRIFYFPLCLAFFYHALLMILIFSFIFAIAFFLNRGAPESSPLPRPGKAFPATRFLPLLAAYVVLGEFFSFGMENKEMRSLLLVLPVAWLGIFSILEWLGLRPIFFLVAAGGYALCGYSQTLFNSFGSTEISTESFQLKDNWLARLPQASGDPSPTMSTTKSLLGLIQQALPHGGRIAVGSEQVGLTAESFIWASQYKLALAGKQRTYDFENFLTVDGKCSRKSLTNAQGIIIYLHPVFQYSREVQTTSINLIQFCQASWTKKGVAQIGEIVSPNGDIMASLIVMKEPLDDTMVTQLFAGSHSIELQPDGYFEQTERRLTWTDLWNILERWKQRRFGR